MNYNLLFGEISERERERKPKLLLHGCCAVCSGYVISLVRESFDVSVFYYNPNIYPKDEYEKRKSEQKRIIRELYPEVSYLDLDYDHGEFLSGIKGLEAEPEGGKRCESCFFIRFDRAAEYADENGFEYLASTLTVSPHKNADAVNKAGYKSVEGTAVKWLPSDFKKRDGFLKSNRLAAENNVYRQSYCGCEFSLRGEEQR